MNFIIFWRFILYCIVLFLYGCGGGSNTGITNITDADTTEKNLKKIASEDDAKANARAVRAFFFKKGGISYRKLQKKVAKKDSETEAETTLKTENCANGGTVMTDGYYEDDIFYYAQGYINCQGDDGNIYNGVTGGSAGVVSNESTVIFLAGTLYNDFSVRYNTAFSSKSFGTMPFSVAPEEGSYNLDVEFSTKIETVSFSGGYSNKLEVITNGDKEIATFSSNIDSNFSNYYKIIGEDGTGVEWTKMDISYKLEELKNDANYFNYQFSVNTEKTIFTKKCSNQYEIKTPHPISFTSNNDVSGEMTFYNKTNDVLTKLLIIDAENIELSADLDKDGIPDYKEKISWSEFFGEAGDSTSLDDYDICR